MKVKKQTFGLELISIFTKHGHIILFAYFLFLFVSCNTLRNYQSKETCIPISILGSYNMKDLSSEDINAVMKQSLCSSDLKQIEDIKIEVKTLRDYREFNRQIWKYFLYP
ncbi:MAG TPA: hypothetical protein PLX69_25460 [Leptospiraceae bacterium]|nr:hypothetical protein [Leptospiraceae bacterium]